MIGVTVLLLMCLLIVLNFGHGILEKNHLSKANILLMIFVLLIMKILIPELHIYKSIYLDIGNTFIPLLLVTNILLKMSSNIEKINMIVISLIVGLCVFFTKSFSLRVIGVETNTLLMNAYLGIIIGFISYVLIKDERGIIGCSILSAYSSSLLQITLSIFMVTEEAIIIGNDFDFNTIIIACVFGLGTLKTVKHLELDNTGQNKLKDVDYSGKELIESLNFKENYKE